MNIKNLHIACGRVYATNFLNIDISPRELSINLEENVITEIPERSNTFVIKMNLKNKFPGEPGTIEHIYHSHFLEHLSTIESHKFLTTCFHALKQSGKMRIAVPDFKLWANNYVNDEQAFFDWYSKNFCKGKGSLTKLEIFNQMIYTGHYYMYDFETLEKTLLNIGFKNIKEYAWGETNSFPGLTDLEKSNSKRKPESLVIECEKIL
jgi:predicted SAM-dependent methyltransferase